jgi:hypothetical protein
MILGKKSNTAQQMKECSSDRSARSIIIWKITEQRLGTWKKLHVMHSQLNNNVKIISWDLIYRLRL